MRKHVYHTAVSGWRSSSALLGAPDGTVFYRDCASKTTTHLSQITCTPHGDRIALSPTASVGASSQWDSSTVSIFTPNTGAVQATIAVDGHVQALAFSDDGRVLAIEIEDVGIKLYNAQNSQQLAVLPRAHNLCACVKGNQFVYFTRSKVTTIDADSLCERSLGPRTTFGIFSACKVHDQLFVFQTEGVNIVFHDSSDEQRVINISNPLSQARHAIPSTTAVLAWIADPHPANGRLAFLSPDKPPTLVLERPWQQAVSLSNGRRWYFSSDDELVTLDETPSGES